MMNKSLPSLLCTFFFFFFFFLFFFLTLSESQSTITQPHASESFNVSYIQNRASCSYNVEITTSCSSVSHTRDQISISFGDAYGNQIYAPRIDDPSTGTFESCSTDTYKISGPCAYQICYVYLYRSGYDGWKPDSVTISGGYMRPVTFYYGTFIPNNVWYGFNLCHSTSSSHKEAVESCLMIASLAYALVAPL